MDDFVFKKDCIVKIRNDDNLCALRCIVVGIAHNNYDDDNSLRNEYKQTQMQKRTEIYSCLCTKLNEKFKSIWINQLFGSPCYVSFLLTIIGISTITAIIVLSQVINTKLNKANKSYLANCTSSSECDNLLGLSCSAQD